MPLYSLRKATLEDIEGQGYMFRRKDTWDESYRGIFIPDDEEKVDELKELIEAEEAEFSGVAYRQLRSGDIRESKKTVIVDLKEVVNINAGQRADFDVVEEVEE